MMLHFKLVVVINFLFFLFLIHNYTKIHTAKLHLCGSAMFVKLASGSGAVQNFICPLFLAKVTHEKLLTYTIVSLKHAVSP
jgi:hypothetical protein